MSDRRLEYYDPLYETITFQRGLPTRQGFLHWEDPIDPKDIVMSAEFSRLAHLKQTGLAWLVFPSATHTRFSHSIGCWQLGRLAESLIKVKCHISANSFIRSLRVWLERIRLREEFYLALLLHDIGHGPLSHTLEHNKVFQDGLRIAGVANTDHEHRGVSLIDCKGPLSEYWMEEIVPYRYGKAVITLKDTKKSFEVLKERICLPSIYYLMTGDDKYQNQCKHSHRECLPVVKELVSGLLDLDRLDHYARDSYFSGIRHVSINLRGFLNNITLDPTKQNEKMEALIWLSKDGASYAASLLFSKRQIHTTMFRNPIVMALHSMINWTLTKYIETYDKNKGELCLALSLMTDDQLIDTLSRSTEDSCKYMCQRIRVCNPYFFIGRWANIGLGKNHDVLKQELDKLTSRCNEDGTPVIIFKYDRDFWLKGRAKVNSEWLDTGRLLSEDTGDCLTDHPDFKDDFLPLREAEKVKYLWAFISNHKDADKILKTLTDLLGHTY